MFDQLLANLSLQMAEAKKITTSITKQVKQLQAQTGRTGVEFHDPTHSLGKAASFPKSERFRELEKEEPKTTDCFYDSYASIGEVPVRGGVIPKSGRFVQTKKEQLTVITPNYDAIKKNNKQAPKIVPPTKDDLGKSRLSQATAASFSQVGPGKYFITEQQTAAAKKTPSFSKSKRFDKTKLQYEDTPLFPNQAQTKKRPPMMAVLKKKTQKNKNQISMQQQEELRERLKLVYWNSIPLQLDRLLKKQAGAPLLKDKYFDLTKLNGRERRAAIMMLLDRLNYERGGFDTNIRTTLGDKPCGVVYRKSTPKPFKFSEMEPGPDYYYPQDDLVKPAPVGFTFARQEAKQNKQADNRDYEINYQYFQKGGNILIMPEHKSHRLTEQQIRSLNRGPGFYDCLFSQVEKRADIGIVKLQEVTDKNARENNCVEIKQVNDAFYFPEYTAIDAKIPGPVYAQPANVRPVHTPEKDLFPEHWMFYDGDLNKVRAEIAKNVLIGNGLNFAQYKQYTNKLEAFKRYMNLRRQQVEPLEYEPKYEALYPHVQGFDMKKQPQKNLMDPIIKPQFEADGDNLLLEPEKPQKRLPDFDFGKMVGRNEEQIGPDDVVDGDVLVINPKRQQKHVPQIDFKKMVARPEIIAQKNQDEEPNEGDRINIQPKYPEKKLPNIDFSKQVSREVPQQDEMAQQLQINPEKPVKIKGFVNMQRMTSVRLVPHLRKKRQDQSKASVISSSRQKNLRKFQGKLKIEEQYPDDQHQ